MATKNRGRFLATLFIISLLIPLVYFAISNFFSGHRSVVLQSLHYFSRPHESVRRHHITSPAAWVGKDLAQEPDKWSTVISEQARQELVDAVRLVLVKNISLSSMRQIDFKITDQVEALLNKVKIGVNPSTGLGFHVLKRMPVDLLSSQDEKEILWWGVGLHLGLPGAQNGRGELLGHVKDEFGGNVKAGSVRQYRTNEKINFHCDAADVVGLLCLRQGMEGGQSRLVSSVSIYNEFLRSYPQLVDRLYESQLLDTRGDGGVRYFAIEPVTFAGGVLRTFWHAEYFRSSHQHPGAPALSQQDAELLDVYQRILDDPTFILDMTFEVGDAQFLSNHVLLHARTAFKDIVEASSGGRLLLRLWLTMESYDTSLYLTALTWWARIRIGTRLMWAKVIGE